MEMIGYSCVTACCSFWIRPSHMRPEAELFFAIADEALRLCPA